jgi:hypothetical protein
LTRFAAQVIQHQLRMRAYPSLWIGADTLQESCLSALAALGVKADPAP